MAQKKVIIIGAAGRDFHNFNVYFRKNKDYEVVAFTAHQIPGIAGRTYPTELTGPRHPKGIPIHDESELGALILKHGVDECVFSYSDIAHVDVMHKAALCNALGADFRLLAAERTMLKSKKPVISVCAVRTGCGKSQTTRRTAEILRKKGLRVVAVRHPMPYGDLNAQRCMRFADYEDMDRHNCTIEEREEFEAYVKLGMVVYCGVDYGDILKEAEKEADVILWDGGNNDTPFFRPDLAIVLADPHRPGHEALYHPGETNMRMAQVIIVNKVGTAERKAVEAVKSAARRLNPAAFIMEADSTISMANGADIKGRRVLVIEDGPTVTHGEMAFGAAHVIARAKGAEIIDPRPHAVGSIKDVFAKFTHLKDVLPAMGYGKTQIAELKKTIEKAPCDAVLVGTPFDLGRLIKTDRPLIQVSYEMDAAGTKALEKILEDFLSQRK